MLIDKTYFERDPLHIVNVAEPEPNNRSAIDLDVLIARCEDIVLSFAFGRVMYEDYKTNPTTYADVINGTTYEKDGKTLFWQGLIQPELKTSLLADFVYHQYYTQKITMQTEFGVVKAENKIGRVASSTPKLTRAMNSFLSKLQGGYNKGGHGLTPEGNPYWIVPNRLNNGYGVDYFHGNTKDGEVSLMQYLRDNKVSFPLFVDDNRSFENGNFKNSFGI